jgi:membrane-bound lytic murein transglycosylase B
MNHIFTIVIGGRISRLLMRIILLGLVLVLLPGPLLAAVAADRDFEGWLADLKKEAISEGVPAAIVAEALDGVKLREEVLSHDRNQPESKLTLAGYLDRIVSEARVAKGRRLLAEHRPLLEEIAARYRVQPPFLLALWGIESDYGRVLGNFPIIQSLVTLAFDPRRGGYFRKELLLTLHILADGQAPPARLRGSWAGAIGGLQFMPSIYRRYGVDYNGDGFIDIWAEPADMLASGANYLAAGGWRFDQTWGREVTLPTGFDKALLGHKIRLPLAKWQELGVRRLHGGRDLPARDMTASVIIPDPDSGRAFLVYDNFRLILRWNRSDLFAIAVGMLADRIGAP